MEEATLSDAIEFMATAMATFEHGREKTKHKLMLLNKKLIAIMVVELAVDSMESFKHMPGDTRLGPKASTAFANLKKAVTKLQQNSLQ